MLISGGGTTLRNLIEKIEVGALRAKIQLVVSSDRTAAGLVHAERAAIPYVAIEREPTESEESHGARVFDGCRAAKVDFVAMAGFLKRVPIPPDFENRVLNIHPALIPAFCGKGFYGLRVHQAALDYGVKVSGCTVHFVDNQYDHGPVLLQKVVPVLAGDDAAALAERVFTAECDAYPEALNLLAQKRVQVDGRRVHIADR